MKCLECETSVESSVYCSECVDTFTDETTLQEVSIAEARRRVREADEVQVAATVGKGMPLFVRVSKRQALHSLRLARHVGVETIPVSTIFGVLILG